MQYAVSFSSNHDKDHSSAVQWVMILLTWFVVEVEVVCDGRKVLVGCMTGKEVEVCRLEVRSRLSPRGLSSSASGRRGGESPGNWDRWCDVCWSDLGSIRTCQC